MIDWILDQYRNCRAFLAARLPWRLLTEPPARASLGADRDKERESEAFFRNIFDSIGIAVVACSDDGIIRLANQAAEGMAGYSRKEMEDKLSWQYFVSADDLPRMLEYARLRQKDPGAVPSRYEFRFIDRDQQPHSVMLSVSRALESGLQVYSLTDLTEIRRMQEQLRQSEARYRALVDYAGDVIWTMNMDYKMTYVSPSVQRMFGWTPEELLALPLEAHIAPASLAFLRQLLPLEVELIRQGPARNPEGHFPLEAERIARLDVEQLRKDGSSFWAEITVRLLLDPDGNPEILLGITRDITERRYYQSALVQSARMTTVAGLASGMAHEINNPLGIIMQSAENTLRRLNTRLPANLIAAERAGLDLEALEKYLEDRHINSYLAEIQAAGSRAARIVESMLSFNRHSDAVPGWLNINQILDKTLELAAADLELGHEYHFSDLELIKDYGDLPDIPGVGTELEQVFFNLLKNSAQALTSRPPEDEPARIRINTWSSPESVFVCLEDNGSGMDEERRSRVFDPFYTTREPGGGTGLGLSVAYYIIVENHRGRISVDSEPGAWTRFTIELPRTRPG